MPHVGGGGGSSGLRGGVGADGGEPVHSQDPAIGFDLAVQGVTPSGKKASFPGVLSGEPIEEFRLAGRGCGVVRERGAR